MQSEFRHFYERYAPYVKVCARSRTSTQDDADDLQALVWWEIYQQFSRFNTDEPRGFIHQLVRWRAVDLRRHQNAHTSSAEDQLAALVSKTLDAQNDAENTHTRILLKQLLQQETTEDRAILIGRYIEEQTWEELAMQLQLHRNTVCRRADASMARLRQALLSPEHTASAADASRGHT